MGKTKNTSAAPAPAGKAPVSSAPVGKAPAAAKATTKRRHKANTSSFSSYIYKVLKAQSPDIAITTKSMKIMDQFCHDVFDRIASEAGRLSRYSKRQTISSKEIQTACQLVIPGELAKHAASQGTQAVTRFQASNQ